jgi:2-hydroxychromene-2-carboxylate isomerase
MTLEATWYFDFISPFAYLQLSRFGELSDHMRIKIRPVVFSALLDHWQTKGPAEIPSKRRFVYRFFKWQAIRRGLPFVMPPQHPFNPIPPLRLALLAGANRDAVHEIFRFIYGEGRNLEDEVSLVELGERLGISDIIKRIDDPDIKSALRDNTDAAIADGAFGVPTFVVEGQLFWGDDSTEMLLDYLRDRNLFESDEMKILSDMPMGLLRPGQ